MDNARPQRKTATEEYMKNRSWKINVKTGFRKAGKRCRRQLKTDSDAVKWYVTYAALGATRLQTKQDLKY